MIAIFDNLTATLISTAVLLMLFAMHQRVTRFSVEQTGLNSAKSQTIEFGKWMQRDMSLIDEGNCPGGTTRGVTDVQEDGDLTKRFAFTYCRLEESTGTVVPVEVVYEVVETGSTVKVERSGGAETVPVLQLTRTSSEVTASDAGKSPPTLTGFQIQALDEDGETVPLIGAGTPGSTVRYLRLQFSATRPFDANADNFLTEVNWMTSIPMR